MRQDQIDATANRYVYDVARRLPQSQKEDISRELHSLIDDMLEMQAAGEPTEQDFNAVLLKLGEPKKLANQYRDKNRYLIGPAYYDQYMLLLKIVLPCVFFGMMAASFVSAALALNSQSAATLTNWITFATANALASGFSGLFQGFAWVTVIFACIEYGTKKELNRTDSQELWNPANLPPVPSENAIIRRSKPIAGIIFTVVVIILFNFVPQLMGVYSMKNGFASIPIFDLQVLKQSLLFLNLCFIAGAAKELFKLLYGSYSTKIGLIILGLNAVTVCFTVLVFSNGAIWNPNFVQTFSAGQGTDLGNIDLHQIWSNLSTFFIAIVVFACALDSAVSLLKGIRADRTL
jgi:hypothetical protein